MELEDGWELPEDGWELPEDGWELPEDGRELPEDGRELQDDGRELQDDGRELVDDLELEDDLPFLEVIAGDPSASLRLLGFSPSEGNGRLVADCATSNLLVRWVEAMMSDMNR